MKVTTKTVHRMPPSVRAVEDAVSSIDSDTLQTWIATADASPLLTWMIIDLVKGRAMLMHHPDDPPPPDPLEAGHMTMHHVRFYFVVFTVDETCYEGYAYLTKGKPLGMRLTVMEQLRGYDYAQGREWVDDLFSIPDKTK